MIIIKKKNRTEQPATAKGDLNTTKDGDSLSHVPREAIMALDGMCRTVVNRSPDAIVSWWLMSAYTKEIHGVSLLSERMRAELLREFSENRASLTHPHTKLMSLAFAGSASGIDFPGSTRFAAANLVKNYLKITIDPEKVRKE